jgi:lipoprotein-anchoring transpeptidase ErfK/SrfK
MPNAVNFDPNGLFTHQGALPGFSASHGCVRMLEKDSKLIFDIAQNEVFPIILYR